LANLSEGSRQISLGNLGYQIPIRGKDELAQTAETFNRMSLNLLDSHRELSLSEAKMRAVLDGAVDGIITIDEAGIVESFNPAAEAIFGYVAHEVIGREVSLLAPEPHKSKHSAYIQHYLNTGKATIIGIGREVEGEHKNGKQIPLELGISEIIVDRKRLFTGILRDVSERKRTEAELLRYRENLEQLVEDRTQELKEAQQKLVEQAFESGRAELAAIMLHNIGNAVTPFSSQINALRESLPNHVITYLEKSYAELVEHRDHLDDYIRNDPRGKQVFTYIGELIGYLNRFKGKFDSHLEKIAAALDYVGDILSLQQNFELERGENRQLTDINDIIDKALKIQQKRLEKGNISVLKELGADLPKLLLEQSGFLQVIVNVIKNACEAIQDTDQTDAPKRLLFRTSADAEAVIVAISDTGIGIEPEEIQRVYERGVSKKGSTGFGLHFIKMFMEKSKGKLEIDSAGIGRGTTIRLFLKRRQATEINGLR
jgi:two-component system sensor kinase FixL